MAVFPIFLFFILLFPVLGVETDDCKPIRCGKHGPKIQTPFRDKDRQPKQCGYPGFDVYCDKGNVVLELPVSVKVVVKKINYVAQEVHFYDPQKCLPKSLPSLNLSNSPFHFLEQPLMNYTLFNCSAPSRELDDFLCTCYGDSSHQLYAVENSNDLPTRDLTSCTKLNETSSVPWNIFDINELSMNWSEPQCGHCEAHGQGCSLKAYTRGHQIQCINKPKMNHGASKGSLIAGVALGSFAIMITFAAFFVLYVRGKENQKKIEKFLEDYRALKPTRFSYSDIRRITHQFSEKLGEGGYGIVYKGKLSNEINVAVKVLNNSRGNGVEFVNEVGTIGRIHHVNVVRLIGFCAEGFRRALVYEFLPNDSLEKFIFQAERNSLGLDKLQDIALGIAKGIEYLHQGCDQRILHFDIKPHNILLDHNFNPKICDFGLAKLCSKEQSAVTMTAARGTMGYIAPEVLSRTFGKASYKSDVYSFGMLLLEMVGGRKNVDDNVNTSQVYFPQWIYKHLNVGEDIWARIEQVEDGNIARKLGIVGLWCIQWHPRDRPCMKQVVQMLEGDEDNLTMPPNPFPDINAAANSMAGITRRRYQTELPLIIESE